MGFWGVLRAGAWQPLTVGGGGTNLARSCLHIKDNCNRPLSLPTKEIWKISYKVSPTTQTKLTGPTTIARLILARKSVSNVDVEKIHRLVMCTKISKKISNLRTLSRAMTKLLDANHFHF